MMPKISILALCLAPFLLACKRSDQSVPQPATGMRPHEASASSDLKDLRPTKKEILHYVIQNQDVSLASIPSCKNGETDLKDPTLGGYVSTYLAEHTNRSGQNFWLVTSAPEKALSKEGPVWNCDAKICRRDGEEVWAWGVTFQVRASDRMVLRDSFRCTGAGF